jgi:uncharacterized protein (DUF2235 family)
MKNIVMCCDGTNNRFGEENTNVVRVVKITPTGPAQVVFYDPGIGTMPDPRVIGRVAQRASEIVDLAFANRLLTKVSSAYSFLMDEYEDGDRIYMFGFSRGAYTVRVLAAVLNQIGVLAPRHQNLLPYAMQLFAALSGERREGGGPSKTYWELCDEFRQTFSRSIAAREDNRVLVHLWECGTR